MCLTLSLIRAPGSLGVPLHWTLQSRDRTVSLRFAPEARSGVCPPWSHPTQLVDQSGSVAERYIAIPVRPPPPEAQQGEPGLDPAL